MMHPEQSGGAPLEELADAFAATGIGMGPVELSRRLIPHQARGRVLEFFSSYVGGKLLALDARSPDAEVHRQLAERGLPVLPTDDQLHPEGFTLLRVPAGVYSLRSKLHLLRSDLNRWGPLFVSIAAVQKRQCDAQEGVAVAGVASLLDHFGLYEYGGSQRGYIPLLLPPYDNNLAGTPESFIADLGQELAANNFTPQQVTYVRSLMEQGVVHDVQP